MMWNGSNTSSHAVRSHELIDNICLQVSGAESRWHEAGLLVNHMERLKCIVPPYRIAADEPGWSERTAQMGLSLSLTFKVGSRVEVAAGTLQHEVPP